MEAALAFAFVLDRSGQPELASVSFIGSGALGFFDEACKFVRNARYASVHVKLAAIVVSHGDADHFSGLTRLVMGRGPKNGPPVATRRVFHNGLAKRPTSAGTQMLGKTAKVAGKTYIVGLADDLLTVPDKELNTPFLAWKSALQRLAQGTAGFAMRRLEYGDADAFDFLAREGIKVDVLGPITEQVNGKPALPMLREPGGGSLSISHTIDGHSVVLRLTFGNVRLLFGADLNEESEQRLLARTRADALSLTSEVLKVPHHGSSDFSPAVLDAIRPVVSVILSDDENGAKEYIHPRRPRRRTRQVRARDGGTPAGLRRGDGRVLPPDRSRERARLLQSGRRAPDGRACRERVRQVVVRHRARPHRWGARAGRDAERQVRPEGGLRLPRRQQRRDHVRTDAGGSVSHFMYHTHSEIIT